jgi:prophage tail gpP-like protein
VADQTDPIEPLRVRVRGSELVEWESVEIHRSIFAGAGSFALTLSDRRPFPIAPGQLVEIWWRRQRMLVGYLEQLEHNLESEDHLLAISGRDSTADLIDCSVDPQGPQEFRNIDLEFLANKLTAPFKIPVAVSGDFGDAFDLFTLEPGESTWSAIERAAKLRGFLAFAPGDGTLLLTTPGTRRAGEALREGVNVLSARLKWHTSDRFSAYHVLQQQRPGADEIFKAAHAGVTGSATDLGVQRYRPLVILGEDAMTDAQAERRAQWEASVRAARAVKIEVDVSSWDKAGHGAAPGQMWLVNELVRVVLPTLRIDDDMLIDEIQYARALSAEQGTTAKLTLVRRNAYLPEPVIPADTGSFLSGVLGEIEDAAEGDERP